jgi:VTC domain-containing protein
VITTESYGDPIGGPLAEDLTGRLAALTPVTLTDLDRRAALGERLERKYALNPTTLSGAMAAWAAEFDVLEIGGRRSFEYRSVYFDDRGHIAFHDHRRQKRQRFKVRTRHYVDSGLCFLEVKLKGGRGATIKRRFPHPLHAAGVLDEPALTEVRAAYADLYGRPLTCLLGPALRLGFTRIMRSREAAASGSPLTAI